MNIQQAADQFIIDKQLSNLSKITINNYKKVLKEFASLYGEVELEDYDSSMVREFLVHLRSRENLTDGSTGLSQTSIELYYRVVHNFSKWCVSQEFIATSPTEKVPRPRLDKLLPETISDEKLVALFQLLENKTTTRIRLIFEFFLDTGCRVSEVVVLNVDDVHLEDGWAKIHGKGSREAIVPLGRNLTKSLSNYLYNTRPGLVQDENEKAFFLTRFGCRYTKSSLSMLVRRYLNEIGVEGKTGPHKLRHTFATNYLRYGGDVESLRRIMRHSSIHTTQRYIALLPEDIINAHQKASPLDNFRNR